ncbi:hypothetical protein H5410_013211 [Solanum commersonii]|uniref:Uncharacterized protein n=1 Tax=Solanum commersonii TaxID=4109 RepID=A0A9J6AUH2_SOLCO|nr:hypothetical protein H5410_013211 [Solanum commersonii]
MLSDTVILCLCDLRNGVEKDLVNPGARQTVLVVPTTGAMSKMELKLEDGKRILFWYDDWVGREYSSTRQVPDLFSFAVNSRATVNVEAIKVG